MLFSQTQPLFVLNINFLNSCFVSIFSSLWYLVLRKYSIVFEGLSFTFKKLKIKLSSLEDSEVKQVEILQIILFFLNIFY